ncbi:MAG: peptidylprolyl isomerase [Puia sp.]|nr:peptidylprolyl isomerase [Puia sp.]
MKSFLPVFLLSFLLLPTPGPAQTAPGTQIPLPAPQMPAGSKPGAPLRLTVPQMKEELEKSPNPVLYAKQILQKRFSIDTIVVTRTKSFSSLADSLAYKGKIKKVYGPFGQPGKRFLVQILSKAPNLFYHVSQIFIDTTVFSRRVADSLANKIIARLQADPGSFEQLTMTYSMGGEAATKGDLGWIARGTFLPQIEHEVETHKKGEFFKVWSSNGLHIVRKTDDPKQDTGFALIMRVFL